MVVVKLFFALLTFVQHSEGMRTFIENPKIMFLTSSRWSSMIVSVGCRIIFKINIRRCSGTFIILFVPFCFSLQAKSNKSAKQFQYFDDSFGVLLLVLCVWTNQASYSAELIENRFELGMGMSMSNDDGLTENTFERTHIKVERFKNNIFVRLH